MAKKTYITAKNISYDIAPRKILDGVSFTVSKGERIGLIGKNGSGKTTLLKIISGITDPGGGFIETKCRPYYLPQIDLSLFASNSTVKDYIEENKAEVWTVKAILERKFNSSIFDFNSKISALSGGELMKVCLATGLAHKPDLLLLDEPTNHLDILALEVLRKFLLDFNGAYIVVSHDPLFLDHVAEQIWELHDNKITNFGGNYSHYREQKKLHEESRGRLQEAATKKVRKLKKSLQVEIGRSARSEKTGRIMAHDRSMSKMEIGHFKNRASASKGILKKRLTTKISQAEQQVKNFKSAVKRGVYITLKKESDKGRRTLINIDEAGLFINDVNFISNIKFNLRYGDRVHIAGANGSGKTCFAKSISESDNMPASRLDGKYSIAKDTKSVYVSQKYEIVKPDKTLLKNMTNSSYASYEQARQQLGNYLFKDEEINKRAGILSGGEIARLALAIATLMPIDLLILDEPTNNLDIETVEILANSLSNFPGAIVAISHNIDFLDQIGIEKSYIIQNRKLVLMNSVPHDRGIFYQEILSRLTKHEK